MLNLLTIFLILCSSQQFSAEITNDVTDNDIVIKLNKAIDTILDFARASFTEDGELSIPLPDQNKKIGKPPINGKFESKSGFFRNPASLRRTGDVAIVKKGDSVSLQVALGLSEINAGSEYKVDFLSIHQAGKINVSIAKDSLAMAITLTYSPKCTIKLDRLQFDELSGIKVDITGLGVFQKMFEQLSSWLISNFEGNIKGIVNKKLYDKVNKMLYKEDLCKYFPQ